MHSGAEWSPQHDFVLKYSLNQTVFPFLDVEFPRIENFSGINFFYTGQQITLVSKILTLFIYSGAELCRKHDVTFSFSREHSFSVNVC